MAFKNRKKNYPLYQTTKFDNVRTMIENVTRRYPDRNALSFKKKASDKEILHYTYAQCREYVRELATEMTAQGLCNKTVAIIGEASPEWVFSYFASMSMGAITVPIDKELPLPDTASIINTAECEYVFFTDKIYEKINELKPLAPTLKSFVSMGADAIDGATALSSLVASGEARVQAGDNSYLEYSIDTEGLASIVFTSGTTGKGKGVMLSQKAILSNISASVPYIDYSEKTIGVLPPHHTYGSTILFLGHTIIGAEVYISAGLRYITKELKEIKPGHLVLVPLYLETFYRKILANVKEQGKEKLLFNMIKMSNALLKVGIDQRKKLFSSIRNAFGGEIKTIISGGAPINPEILAFFEAIGISTLNGYGITECSPLIAFNRSLNIVPGSVGNVIDIDHVIIDEPNEEGEGEILVKGPNVMLGYYKDEEATAEAITDDGYFRTGDYGKLDENNILYITGRKKNLIILSNGKNVYPEEIENELIATPGVLEIIVYEGISKRGIAHNAIVAEVFPDNEYCEKNNITDIKTHLKKYIDDYNRTAVPYKKIALLKIRNEEFPKNTLRKTMRFKIDTTID